MRRILALVALTACGTPPAETPSEPIAATPAAPPTPAEVCAAEHCATAADAEACAAEHCAHTPLRARAGVKKIRFEEHTLFVGVTPEITPARIGDTVIEHTEPVYVGVTAVTPSGREIDLLVQEVIPGSEQGQVVFTAELDDRIDHVLVGLWGEKIAPCEVARSGCEEFGFVLDESLATYPPDVYVTGQRQRLLTEPLSIAVLAPQIPAQDAQDAISEAASAIVAVYGVPAELHAAADASATSTEVRYRHPRDAFVAERVRKAVSAHLGREPLLRYTPDAPGDDLVVVLGG